MYAWQATVQDEAGNIVPLPVVTVYLNNGTTLASIFNEAGAPLPNPLTGTMEGFVQFWANAGQYKIRGAKSGNATEMWAVTIDAPAIRAEQSAAAAAASAGAAAASAAEAAFYSVPRFNSRVEAASAAASWPNGTILYVNSRKFVVDTSGPDRLLAIDYDWSGQFDGVVSRALQGSVVKFACYGDSTTDGNGTTDWTANPTDASGNAIGSEAHNPPNAWPAIFRSAVRAMFNNTNISVWNAGYGGKEIVSGWATSNFARAVINNPAYGVPDVCFINFGLNDAVRAAFTRDEFIRRLNYLINLMDYYGIVPVFMTPDPVSQNTQRQGGNMVKIDTLYREVADKCGILVIDNGAALNSVYSSNGTNNLWFYQQPDGLHGGNAWHRVKGSHVAARTFPKTLFIEEEITNVAPWSKYANTSDNTYSLFSVSNRFGASMNITGGSYAVGSNLAQVWVWNEKPNMQSMWFSIDGDGYHYPRPPSDAPRLRMYSYFSGSTIANFSQTAGCSIGATGVRQSEAPMRIGTLDAGLSRVEFVAPTDNNSNVVYAGYFSFRQRSRPASCSAIFPTGGSGMVISDNDRFGSYGQATGFGFGRNLKMVADVQMPVGTGLILFTQRVYGSPSASVDQDRVSMILFRGGNNVALYQISVIGSVTSIIGGPIVSSTYAWREGVNQFAMDFYCNSAGQTLNVYEQGSTTPLLSHTRPLSGNPVLSGGDVGGFFHNYNAGNGGTASAIIYDITPQ